MKVIFQNDGKIGLDFENGLVRKNLTGKAAGGLLREYGISIDEFEYGVSDAEKNGHNVLHFGINRTFIFSERKNLDG